MRTINEASSISHIITQFKKQIYVYKMIVTPLYCSTTITCISLEKDISVVFWHPASAASHLQTSWPQSSSSASGLVFSDKPHTHSRPSFQSSSKSRSHQIGLKFSLWLGLLKQRIHHDVCNIDLLARWCLYQRYDAGYVYICMMCTYAANKATGIAQFAATNTLLHTHISEG